MDLMTRPVQPSPRAKGTAAGVDGTAAVWNIVTTFCGNDIGAYQARIGQASRSSRSQ